MATNLENLPEQVQIKTAVDLGHYLRAYRKAKGITLHKLSGLSNVSTKFLSEFERGKETAEIGKILKVINVLGLKVSIQPRAIHGWGKIRSPASINGTASTNKNRSRDEE